jgi:hypothetical protein
MPGSDKHLLLYLAMVPKRDASHAYLTQYYGTAPPQSLEATQKDSGRARSWEELANHCAALEGWKPFRSKSAAVNWIGAGLAIAYLLPKEDLSRAESVAEEAVSLWLGFLNSNSTALDEDAVEGMARRDTALRRLCTYGDPYFKMLSDILGQETFEKLGRLVSKGEPDF